ncbi:family 43 glycosylhydrolase [Wukongibacter baidiensis]|uniref:family 43 glycosylhydrolase n=1 Tax=Wukongibacter baidiensis TaxID=1723361 RepID=UPI003D7F4EF6
MKLHYQRASFIGLIFLIIGISSFIIYKTNNDIVSNIKPINERNISEFHDRLMHLADYGIEDIKEIIQVGDNGDFDEGIRELGNIIYDSENKEYKLIYSGYKKEYEGNNVYIGYAHSSDGKEWIKEGKILNRASEDPYLIKTGKSYYLFVEDKEEVPFRNIRRFSSKDFIKWNDDGIVLETGDSCSWEDKDVSSPVVWIENNMWYMLYEGRSEKNQKGAIGLAVSKDGLNWTKNSKNPILVANNKKFFKEKHPQIKWATHLVPDDIIKLDENYYLTVHAYNPKDGWLPGLINSKDLTEFNDALDGPIPNLSKVKIKSPMFFQGTSQINIMTDTEKGICCSYQSEH